MTRHPLEDEASHRSHLLLRSLRRHRHGPIDVLELEHELRERDEREEAMRRREDDRAAAKAEKKRRRRYDELLRSSGIEEESVHGLMIDAGSTGSRMHVYQFAPRTLASETSVRLAVRGSKLSYPGIESRWTERLRPGIASFARLDDEDELRSALASYLEPLLDFAKTLLHTKRDRFHRFPVFLKATAGMRALPAESRRRIVSVVRELFGNSTYCPFWDQKERVRVISGEEEAVYGWTGVNFLLGHLMERSEGAGEADPSSDDTAIQTYGALDMGGASAQISFYEPDGDVMSGLFKLQIGQGKHWNVYAHSHLMFGHNAAEERYRARLVKDVDDETRLIHGVYDPCLPGGKRLEFKSNIHFDDRNGIETWNASVDDIPSVDDDGSYHAVLVNNEDTGDWDECKEYVRRVLNEKSNAWCDFSHLGSCSFAGVYQPELPRENEFLAFSNYYHVWRFLQLPSRSSIANLDSKGRQICSQSWEDLVKYNKDNTQQKSSEDELARYCFQSAYVHQILRNGYGFHDTDNITATNIINGQKVSWALGSMLYEINTLPWEYIGHHGKHHIKEQIREHLFVNSKAHFIWFFALVITVSLISFYRVLRLHRKVKAKNSLGYKKLKDVNDNVEIDKLPLRKI